jgi:hypothetical protein
MSSDPKKSAASAPTTASSSAPTPATSSAAAPASSSAATPNYPLPSEVTLNHAAKLAIVEDKPIMMDYWVPSLEKKALIGIRESREKLLVKSEDEYTSSIAKFYKSKGEFIIITENSIYIVSADIPNKRIS